MHLLTPCQVGCHGVDLQSQFSLLLPFNNVTLTYEKNTRTFFTSSMVKNLCLSLETFSQNLRLDVRNGPVC